MEKMGDLGDMGDIDKANQSKVVEHSVDKELESKGALYGWQAVPYAGRHTRRLAVPGGWLVGNLDYYVFIEDPLHRWEIKHLTTEGIIVNS